MFDDIRVVAMDIDGLNAAERRQLERVQRYSQMRLEGAAIGGLGGAVAGFLIVGKNRGAGAAAGVVVGAAAGYLAGAYVANLNEQAEDRRGDLNTQLAAANDAVSETKSAVRDTREIVSAERSRITRLNRGLRAGSITQAQYREEIGQLGKKMTIVDESLRAAETDAEAIGRTAETRRENGDSGAGKLDAQRMNMEREVARLRTERDKLFTAVGSIPPEIGGPSV